MKREYGGKRNYYDHIYYPRLVGLMGEVKNRNWSNKKVEGSMTTLNMITLTFAVFKT